MPTVLNYLNYPDDYIAFGQDLFHLKNEPFAINYLNNVYQLFMGDYMLQYNDEKNVTVAIYDFKNDLLLKNNMLNKLPVVQQKMENKVKAFIQTYNYRMLEDKMTVEGK